MDLSPHVRVYLRRGREESLRAGSPLGFSGAVGRIEGEVLPRALCLTLDSRGRFLAQGYYNPHSQIACRVFTFSERPLDASFFSRRPVRALELRKQSLPPQTTG
ncbi:MAG: hypothetical protein DRI92_05150 [Aquificota bacterium]|nr:MAG: hypothetical protein DRI92_05150 [Aquificota bacterium]